MRHFQPRWALRRVYTLPSHAGPPALSPGSATEKILARARQLVDVKKEDGFSALHLAALNNHRDVAEILIKEVSRRPEQCRRVGVARATPFANVWTPPPAGTLRRQHQEQPQPDAAAAGGDAGPHRPGAAAGGGGRRRQHGGRGRRHRHARCSPAPPAGQHYTQPRHGNQQHWGRRRGFFLHVAALQSEFLEKFVKRIIICVDWFIFFEQGPQVEFSTSRNADNKCLY